MAKHADEVIPGAAVVMKELDQVQAGYPCQRAKGVRIKSIAIDGETVNRSGGRSDDDHEAVRREDSSHLGKQTPELLTVFEHLSRDEHVSRTVVKRHEIRRRH